MEISSLASGWAAAVLRASWEGGAALVLVWAVSRAAPRIPASLRMWLWRIAYLKLLIAFLWGTPVELPILAPAAAPSPRAEAPGALPTVSDHAAPPAPKEDGPRVLMLLWLAGVAAGSWRIGGELIRLRRLRHEAEPLREGPEAACLAELCGSLGIRRLPALLRTEERTPPMLAGLTGPAILLPSTLSSIESSELRLVLSHELAHLKRGDLAWCWLPIAARILFFFHPLVWVAEAEWRLTQEVACDEHTLAATGTPPGQYADALLRAAAACRPRERLGQTTAAVAESYVSIRRRITAMRYLDTPARAMWARAGSALLLLGCVALIPWRATAQGAGKENPVPAAQPPNGAPHYLVSARFMEAGRGGRSRVLSEPKILVGEGSWATVDIGAQLPGASDPAQPLQTGHSVRIQITPGKQPDSVTVDVTVEQRGVDQRVREGVRVRGTNVRTVETLKLGDTLKLDLPGAAGQPLTRAEIQIVRRS